MDDQMYYFAYGSNMHPGRMEKRCRGAVPVGPAVLRDFTLAERKFADIDRRMNGVVHGVLYRISERHLTSLDLYEGYPRIYRRHKVNVECNGTRHHAVVYEMTEDCKISRAGIPYPEEYRKLCSDGARFHHVEDHFALGGKA